MTFTTFNECLDDIYRSYMSIKYTVEGKRDSEVRDPTIVISIATELQILPKKADTIKITGSKGKGTVSRIVNNILVDNIQNATVGLLVSPEEFDHNDRMKINNQEISKEEFIRVYNLLKPTLLKYEEEFTGLDYLSPSGLFLLIGLYWFKENSVKHYVLELGRGAKYDEVGQIPSALSTITSILDEHASYLGPEIKDIAFNKFYVHKNSDILILGPLSSEANKKYQIIEDEKVIHVSDKINDSSKPHWYLLDEKIAMITASKYCEYHKLSTPKKSSKVVSASFGMESINNTKIIYEPLVSIESIDEKFIKNLVKNHKNLTVLASLPDDKDIVKLIDFFKNQDIDIRLITLSGTRGYLHYETTNKYYKEIILDDISYLDIESMVKIVDKFSLTSDVLYLLGTHTYIRLVKMALRNLNEGVETL